MIDWAAIDRVILADWRSRHVETEHCDSQLKGVFQSGDEGVLSCELAPGHPEPHRWEGICWVEEAEQNHAQLLESEDAAQPTPLFPEDFTRQDLVAMFAASEKARDGLSALYTDMCNWQDRVLDAVGAESTSAGLELVQLAGMSLTTLKDVLSPKENELLIDAARRIVSERNEAKGMIDGLTIQCAKLKDEMSDSNEKAAEASAGRDELLRDIEILKAQDEMKAHVVKDLAAKLEAAEKAFYQLRSQGVSPFQKKGSLMRALEAARDAMKDAMKP